MQQSAPKNIAEAEARIREYLKSTGSDYTGPIPVRQAYTEETAKNYQGGAAPVVGYIQSGNFSEQAPVNIGVSLNPETSRVEISAPDFYINSDHFKNNVLPQFESLNGMDISNPEVTSFLQNNLTNYLKEDAVRIGQYMEAVQQFASHVPGATDEDFNLYGTIVNANKDSDDVMLPTHGAIRDKDGKVKLLGEQSAKGWFKRLNDMNDQDRAAELASIRNLSKSENPTMRAAALGLLDFAQNNELTKAREFGTQLDSFVIGTTEGLRNGFLTSAVADATGAALGGDLMTPEEVRQTPVFSSYDNLGTSNLVGNIAGIGLGIGGDLAASSGILRGLGAAGQLAGRSDRIGEITANALTKGGLLEDAVLHGIVAQDRISKGLSAVSKVPILGGVVRETPFNLTFSALQAANNNGYDAPKEFLTDTAITAALLGTGRAIKPVAAAIENSKAFQGVNAKAAQNLAKFSLMVTSIPGVGHVSQRLARRTVDSLSAARRATKEALAEGLIDINKFKQYANDFTRESSGAIGGAQRIKTGSEARAAAVETEKVVLDSAKAQLGVSTARARNALADYVADRQLLERIDKVDGFAKSAGMNKTDIENLRTRVEKQPKLEQFDQYYEQLGRLNEEYVDAGIRLGTFDDSLINNFRQSGVNYIRLQRDLSDISQPIFGSTGKDKKNLIKRTRKSERSAINPIVSADSYLDEMFQKQAKARVSQIIKELTDLGWKGAEVVSDAKQVRRLTEIRETRKAIETGVREAVKKNSDELIRSLRNAVEEIDNIADGKGVADDAYDKLVGVEASKFSRAVVAESIEELDKLAEFSDMSRELKGLVVADYLASKEGRAIIYKELSDEVGRALREDEWALLTNSIYESLNNIRRSRQGVATRTGESAEDIASAREAMGSLREEGSSLREDTSRAGYADSDLVPYMEDGTTGYMQIKDPILSQYFHEVSKPPIDNWLVRSLNVFARLARFNLTGGSVVFLPVAASRDIIQTLVMNGPNAASRNASLMALLEGSMSERQIKNLLDAIDASTRYGNYFEAGRSPIKALTRTNMISNEARVQQRIDSGRTGNLFKDARVWGESKVGARAASAAENWLKQPITYTEELFSMPEQYLRKKNALAAALTAKQRGLTDEQAIEEAVFAGQNVLANFRPMGKSMGLLNQLTPYLNAMIQGQASFYRMLQLDPLGVAMRINTSLNLPVFYAMAWNLSDPERADVYRNMADYDLENNIVIVLDSDVEPIKIPIPQEFRGMFTTMRESMEAWYGVDQNSFLDVMGKTFLNAGPMNFGPALNRGVDGQLDGRQAFDEIAREVAGSVVPQFGQMAYSAFTGRDPYTGGMLNPDDDTLYERGDVSPGEEITDADRTFRSRDSLTLGSIANALGVPQGQVQQFVRQVFGTNGQLAVNALDKLAGAPEDRQGGRGLGESFARRFFGTSQTKAENQFYRGLNDLEEEKKQLEARLKASSRDFWSDDEQQDANYNLRQELLSEYAEKVANFANNYDQYWQSVGGLKDWQRNRFVKLLNFNVDFGLSAPGSADAQARQQLSMDESMEAQRRAHEAGLDPFQMTKFFDGLNLETGRYETGNTPFSNMIRNQRYGAPKEMVADFKTLTKANKQEGIQSLSQIKRSFQERVSAIYDRGNLTQADYDEIEQLQNEYMQQFDARMQPLIEKYGPLVFNNYDVINELRGLVMIPRSEWAVSEGTGRRGRDEYLSTRKFPNATADVRKILLERYGVGGRDVSNLPSDGEVQQRIESINKKLEEGRGASAMAEARTLQARIDSGSVYANDKDLSIINNVLGL